MTNPIEPPRLSKGDVIHAIVKAAVGAVPYVGSAASEVFALVVATPYQKRQTDWMDSVGSKFSELESQQAGTVERLQNDPAFIDTLLQATQAAMRTSDDEKRAALRNAVLNSVAEDRPDDSRRQMFVNMIDELTPWHLRLLSLLDDPAEWFRRNKRPVPQYAFSSSLSQLIGDAFPELQSERELRDQIGRDLSGRGLLKVAGFETMMTASGAFNRQCTETGQKFLKFISEPA